MLTMENTTPRCRRDMGMAQTPQLGQRDPSAPCKRRVCLGTVFPELLPVLLPLLLEVLRVHRDEALPLFRCLIERENRFYGTGRNTRAAVDAFVGMNVEHLRRLKL